MKQALSWGRKGYFCLQRFRGKKNIVSRWPLVSAFSCLHFFSNFLLKLLPHDINPHLINKIPFPKLELPILVKFLGLYFIGHHFSFSYCWPLPVLKVILPLVTEASLSLSFFLLLYLLSSWFSTVLSINLINIIY